MEHPGGPVTLLVNGASRRGAAAFAPVRDLLEAAGVEVAAAELVRGGGELRAAVERAARADVGTVVVGGGDGTVGSVAGALAELPRGERPVLGVLPLGTANDFARTLSLPRELTEVVRVLVEGKVVDVDLGRAAGRPFLNVASVGLSVAATQALAPRLKRWLGPVAYPVATARAYRHHRPFRARLSFPDGDREPVELDDLLQVGIGNGRHYGGGNTVAPDAGIDDATLDVYAIRAGRLRDHLSLARLLRSGTIVHHEDVQHLLTEAVLLETDTPLPVNLDGEIEAATPVEFRVQRNAFEVLVPQHVTHLDHDGDGPGRHRGSRVG